MMGSVHAPHHHAHQAEGFFSIIKDNLNFLKGSKSGAGTQEETAAVPSQTSLFRKPKASSSENITEFYPSTDLPNHMQRVSA